MKRNPEHRREAGFTLIEVLAALVLSSLVLVSPQPASHLANSIFTDRVKQRRAIFRKGLSFAAMAGLAAWCVYLLSHSPTEEELSLAELRLGRFKTLDHIRIEGTRLAEAAGRAAVLFAPLGGLTAVVFNGWLQTNRRRRARASPRHTRLIATPWRSSPDCKGWKT